MRVCVVGAGISGLAAARALADRWDVCVLEAGSRLGGKLQAVSLEGVRLDGGAESVLARRPEAVALIRELGLQSRLVHPTDARPALLVDGRVLPLPPSMMGVPTDLSALAGVLTPDGLRRAQSEPGRPAPALSGDVAIGRLVDDRFGSEVTDRLLEPILGGVYAGRARELSFEAVATGLFERARAGGSLLAAAAAANQPSSETPVFAGLVGGVASLVDALADDLAARGVEVRTEVTVRALAPAGSGGYRLTAGPVPAPELMDTDAVVLAAPATATGRLLEHWVAEAVEWSQIPYASLAVVTLVVAGVRPQGSGLLVPPGGLPTIKALTYSSRKWGWVSDAAAERWGPGVSVVRASVGRMGEEALLQLPDEALLQRTFAEAATLPEWEGARLVTGHVSRWGGGLPQYRVGHRGLVARMRAALESRPGLAICGAALDGVGIAACLASAEAAVRKVNHDVDAGQLEQGEMGRQL